MDNDAAIMEAVDENTADLDALLPHLPRTANGTFIDGIDYRFRWKHWSYEILQEAMEEGLRMNG